MKRVSETFGKELSDLSKKMWKHIDSIIASLGGKICVQHYEEIIEGLRYTYFTIDNNGYGKELFLKNIVSTGYETNFYMSDSEDAFDTYWWKYDFTTTETYYLLCELEAIAEYVEKNGESVVTEMED